MKIPELKIPKFFKEPIINFLRSASKSKIDFFMIGATARDLLYSTHGISPDRATHDIDFGLRVASWEVFHKLREQLIQDGFQETSILHRLLWNQIPIDFVPFGDLEKPKGFVKFSKDETILSTLGFKEAFDASHKYKFEGFVINIASLAGIFLLKLVAWNDRPEERQTDVQDMARIMTLYFDAGNMDRFYDQHADLVESLDPFEIPRAGVRLLGRDLHKICEEKTREKIAQILERELSGNNKSLLAQMPEPDAYVSDYRVLIEDLKREI